MKCYKPGEFYSPVWWSTYTPKGALILKVTPYRGKYPQHYSVVLRLAAPDTRAGYLDMVA